MTPRLNPEVNSYWMCDIGRFDYTWVEGDRRLLQPRLGAVTNGRAVPWADALIAVKDAIDKAGSFDAVQFFVSAHASLEELFVLREVAQKCGDITISWRHREKPQPPNTTFKIPAVDAPNVRGARDLGFEVGDIEGPADVSRLKDAVDAGRVKVLYVFDSGPEGSIGDTNWIVEARAAGKIAALIVQGVLHTPLSDAADIVLPGCAFVEKDATYTNAAGHVQAASRVIPPPGDAGDDWQILMKLAMVFGENIAFASAGAVREAIARALASVPGYDRLPAIGFARPVAARHWLQASNPSERWKWDFMFQDLPPVKFGEEFGPLPRADVIPLKEVK